MLDDPQLASPALFDPDLLGAPIKAISLWQPWASLVAAGVKRHETRHWSTAYRGPIAIHAAKTLNVAGARGELCEAALGRLWQRTVPLGMVVAVGRLAACRETRRAVADGLTRADLAAGNYAPGRYAWRLDDIRPLRRPIPALGRQGLFNWTPPDDANVAGPLNHAEACRFLGWS